MNNPEGNRKLQLSFWIGILILLTFSSSTQTAEPFLAIRSSILSFGILVYLIGFYLLGKQPIFKPTSKTTTVFFGGLIGFGIWQIITAFSATNLAEAFFPITKFFLFSTVCYLFFQFLKTENSRLDFFKFLAILIATHALIGVYQYGFVDTGTPNVAKTNWFFGHRNLWGSFLSIGVFFCLYFALYEKNGWKIVGMISTAAAVGGILISQSRSTWLAFAAGIIVWSILRFLKNKKPDSKTASNRNFPTQFLKTGAVIVIAIISIFLLSDSANKDLFFEKFKTLATFQTDGDEYKAAPGSIVFRIKTWEQSLAMLGDHPLTGVGRGNWKIHIPEYGISCYEESSGGIVRHSAHNDYLELACETGLIGIAFLFLLAITIGAACKQTLKNDQPNRMAFAMIAALVALATDMLFSFPTDRIEHLVLAAICLSGLLLSPPPEGGPSEHQQIISNSKNKNAGSYIILTTLILATSFALWVSINRYNFEKNLKSAQALFYKAEYADCIKNAKNADSFFHGIGREGDPPELFGGMAKHISGKPAEALIDFETGLKKHPNSARLYNALGSLFSTEKNCEKAVTALEKAMSLTPNHEVVKKNLLVNYFRTERYQKCIDIAQTMNIQADKRLYSMYIKAFEMRELKKKNALKSKD